MTKISFTMADLINAGPCPTGLDRLTRGLGTYSGLTAVTISDIREVENIHSDVILWALKLTDLSDHEQTMIAVKTAIHAAEQVKHLGNSAVAQYYIDIAQTWVDNPCVAARMVVAEAWGVADVVKADARVARLVLQVIAKSHEGAVATANRAGLVVSPIRVSRVGDDSDSGYTAEMLHDTKTYLIQLLEDHDHD